MKKKILSLLLIVSLMMAFATTSFASVEKVVRFELQPNEQDSVIIRGGEISSSEHDLEIRSAVVALGHPVKYVIEVYNLSENAAQPIKTYIAKNESTVTLKYYDLIDPDCDYKIVFKNTSAIQINGAMVASTK